MQISRQGYKINIIPVKEVEAYETSDGVLHKDEDKAREHQLDLLGEALEGFLPHDDRGNVTMSDRHNILMKQLEDDDLINKIKNLYNIVTFNGVR